MQCCDYRREICGGGDGLGQNRGRRTKKHVVVAIPVESVTVLGELRSRRAQRLTRKYHKQDLNSDLSGSPKLRVFNYTTVTFLITNGIWGFVI